MSQNPERDTDYFREVMVGHNPNRKSGPELQAEETDRQNRTQERHRDDFNHLTKGFAPPVAPPQDTAQRTSPQTFPARGRKE